MEAHGEKVKDTAQHHHQWSSANQVGGGGEWGCSDSPLPSAQPARKRPGPPAPSHVTRLGQQSRRDTNCTDEVTFPLPPTLSPHSTFRCMGERKSEREQWACWDWRPGQPIGAQGRHGGGRREREWRLGRITSTVAVSPAGSTEKSRATSRLLCHILELGSPGVVVVVVVVWCRTQQAGEHVHVWRPSRVNSSSFPGGGC